MRNKRHHARIASESISNANTIAKYKESCKQRWLALKAKKQSERCLKDALNQDVQKEVSTVKKRLMKNDDRLLEIAVDVDKMVDMLRDMKALLDRSYEFASKAPRTAHKKDDNVV
jgi:hypothetical protein